MSAAVITGLGTVTASGCGEETLAEDFAQSRVRLSPVDRSDGFHRCSNGDGHKASNRGAVLGALVDGADFSKWLKPAQARRMSPLSRHATVAAMIASSAAASGLAPDSTEAPIDAPDTRSQGVFLGCAYGPTSYTQRILQQIFVEGPTAVSPSLFTESVANAPAAQIALQLGIRGPNVTVTQREAGSLIALGMGAAEVRSGRLERAFCGAVDELNPLLHAALDHYRALARSRGPKPEQARPFDRHRNGFVAGEGSTVVIVEAEDAVQDKERNRSRPPLARIIFSASAFDPDAPRDGWSRCPNRLARALASRLADANIDPADIDLVVSGANGSIAGDRLEAEVLKQVWSHRSAPSILPPILAPKAVTGEQGGSTLAAAILALDGRPFGPTPGFDTLDPELGLAPHRGGDLKRPERVLITGLAVGGAAAWAVLERCA